MQLAIRNKWISLRGSSVVKDAEEKDVLKVRGKFWSITSKKFITTLDDQVKYMVRNKFWRLFTYRGLIYDANNKLVASIRRKIFSLHDRYFIESNFGKFEIRGNILLFDYHIIKDGVDIGHVARRISLRDSFVLDINDNEDYYFFVALVIAIDNITDRRQNNANS